MSTVFPLLSKKEQSILKDALHYMKMAELKKASEVLHLSNKGKKAHLINGILVFIRFMQKMEKENPKASKQDLLRAWKLLQKQKKDEGFRLLKKSLI